MKTELKRGYTWEYFEEGEIVRLMRTIKRDDGGEPIVDYIDLDKVAQYSCLAFLARVLRRRSNKRIKHARKPAEL